MAGVILRLDDRTLSFPAADTYISSLAADFNFEGEDELDIGFNGGKGAQETRTILDIQLPIPLGATVVSATFYLYGYSTPTTGGGAAATFHRIDNSAASGDVVVDELTWNSKSTGNAWATAGGDLTTPTASFTLTDTTEPSGDVDEDTVDFTELVQDAITNRNGRLLVMATRDDTMTNHVARYASIESVDGLIPKFADGSDGYTPRLEVVVAGGVYARGRKRGRYR